MKKTRLGIGLALLLVAATLLMSCGGSVGVFTSFDKVLNEDYDVTEHAWAEAKELSELEGYVIQESVGSIVLLYRLNESTGVTTYKILNMDSGAVILTFVAENTVYEFDLKHEALGLIFVTENYFYDADAPVQSPTFARIAYDKTGAEISKLEDESPKTPFALGDVVVYDNATYRLDKATGALTRELEIPEHLELSSADTVYGNDDYYYMFEGNSIFVYDTTFRYVSFWSAPSYALIRGRGVLNNGDILVQYSSELDEDDKEFDFYETSGYYGSRKYDLVTLLVNPKSGKTREVDLKYIVNSVSSCDSLYDGQDDNNYYNNNFDNIAYVSPIVNQKIDTSVAAQDVVLLSDSGKIKKSLKLVEGQKATLPEKISADVYSVPMLHGGVALITIDGEVLTMINRGYDTEYLEIVGGYIVSEQAIYDLNFEVIYSLKENKAKKLGAFGDTVFVQEGADDAYTVYAFRNGEKKTVYTNQADGEDVGEFSIVLDLGYVLHTAEGGYAYYNADGELLLTTAERLKKRCESENGVLYVCERSVDDEYKTTYYLIQR